MNSNSGNSRRIALLTLLSTVGMVGLAGMATAQADNGTWLDGGGDWIDPGNWQDGIVAGGSGSTATFGKPSASSTITLSEDVTLGGLFLSGAWTPNLTAYTLSGTGKLILDNGANVPTITLPTVGVSGTVLTIDTVLKGSNGLRLAGPTSGFSYLMLNSAVNEVTGGIEIANNVRLFLGTATGLGNNTVTLNGANGGLFFGTTGAVTGTLGNDFVLSSSTTIGYNTAGTRVELSGTISETGSARSILYAGNTGSGTPGQIIVSGDNSYTGNTTLSNIRVRAKHSNALGTGTSEVVIVSSLNNRSALELEGGITISDKKLTLGGTGNANTGTLVSIDGDNTWEGEVVLGNASEGRIGVLNDSLTIAGTVSSTTGTILNKVGDGTLRLEGSNTYTTGTTVSEGILIAANAQALGTGGVTVQGGATLQIDQGITVSASALSLEENARLAFNLSDEGNTAPRLIIVGDQLGNVTYTIDILNGMTPGEGSRSYTLMEVQGNSSATGFVLGLVPEQWNAELQWVNQTLTLNVTAIPEPGSVALLSSAAVCAALLIGRQRKTPTR